MSDTEAPDLVRDGLTDRVAALMAHEPNFARFLRAVAASADPEDIAAYDAADLEALFREAYRRLGEHKRGAHGVYYARTRFGDRDVIEVFSPNMPFIVDSVLAAIRAQGGVIRFMTHPVLTLDPEAFRVLETPGAPGTVSESFLQIHIDPLPDEKARKAMTAELDTVLGEVERATAGWKPMLERLFEAAQTLQLNKAGLPEDVVKEAALFLSWMADQNFTFLGMRDYALVGEGPGEHLEPVEDSGLGILSNTRLRFLRAGPEFVEMTRQHVAFLNDAEPLMVTKANIRAKVHRRSHMDYIGVKRYGRDGKVAGELRIIGLFTSRSLAAANAAVPLIRRKIASVMARSGLEPASHAGKALMAALDNYPRDELFQIGVDQLYEFATIIAQLGDRPRVRVLARADRFDNFVSVLLYLPRDRYNSDVRAKIGTYLAEEYDGRLSAYYPYFPEGDLVRVHFIIGRDRGPTPRPSREDVEAAVTDLTRSYGEQLTSAAADPDFVASWRDAFSAAYQSRNTAGEAIADIAIFVTLADAAAAAVKLRRDPEVANRYDLRVYHRESPIPLSDRVPMLENFGFRVIDEQTYTLTPADGTPRFLHDMEIELADGGTLEVGEAAGRIEAAILAVWRGEAENDRFNQLTLKARLAWFDVTILRGLSRYLRQIGLGFSQSYLANVLATHPDVVGALVLLFHALNDPGFTANRDRAAYSARDAIGKALEATQSLDEDTILRRFLNLVESSVRTNFYQRDEYGNRRPALAIKFDTSKIDALPEPKPYREIFVYSPRVEGLHLRFGPIARGGIRWSDRPEDFRTEVLGLVKAQQVKNAVIVPVGAKGGFVPKRTPPGAPREVVQAEGIACYRIFIGALLDVTDNLRGDIVLPPPDVRRRDGDDPYLVVAADKGTATFSDTANSIALERGFWLGDAFASGGSVGYDHKKMGITARGAWEAVKRHFRELDRDIQAQDFTTVGVGDMSGDVFGNGMLLSEHTRLVAAFDHRDIFIDPTPDAAKGMAERQRLFALPRSSWQDYDKRLLSEGGGIYSRATKSIPLSDEARKALGIGEGPLTPNDVVTAILKAPVDLLFFGGIGTYIRERGETDAQVGDRANDPVRITGRDVRAKVIGEGANLAMTQRGRIEYARAGGRLNTDAIDNSAGVNSSDLEVNIKIALGALVRAGSLTTEQRNEFLPKMTPEVAALCLRNNYLQSLCLSLAQRNGLADLPGHVALMHALAERGQLNRRLEFLPEDAAIAERGSGLTRPELSVILAYAKNALAQDLLAAGVTNEPYLAKELYRYFPDMLADTYPDSVANHRLRSEVIATVLCNAMINRGGPAFVVEAMGATTADIGQVARAYAVTRDVYGLTELNSQIDKLDGKVPGDLQLSLYGDIQSLLRAQTLWFLRNTTIDSELGALVQRFSSPVGILRGGLPALLPNDLAAEAAARVTALTGAGVPETLARRIAELAMLSLASDIVLVAERTGAAIVEAAEAFFGVIETFGLAGILSAGPRVVLADRFDRMAFDRALANLMRALRDLSADIVGFGAAAIPERIAAWHAEGAAAIDRVTSSVAGLTEGELTVSRLSVAGGLLSDLARSA